MDTLPPQPLPRLPTRDQMVLAIRRHVEETQQLISDITSTITPETACFGNVILPLAELENSQAGERAVIEALKYCSPDAETRRASEQGELIWRQHSVHRNYALYLLVKTVKTKNETLDPESNKLIDMMLLDFVQSGMELAEDGDKIKKWRKNAVRIEQLCLEFQSNLREGETGEWFTTEELEGVPEYDLATYPTDETGEMHFVSHNGRTIAISQYAKNEETRKRLYLSGYRRCPENVAIFREILLLRDENARALGYKSHAALRVACRIAESTEWVDGLLNGLAETLLPYGQADHNNFKKRIEEHARSNGKTSPLKPWDEMYYSSLAPNPYRVDHRAVSGYFPLGHTVTAMMDLAANCFQLQFKPVPRSLLEQAVWHRDVKAWAVWDDRPDSPGEFVGYLYADLTSRPNKYNGNQSVNLQRGYLRSDGTRVYPANILMCSFQSSGPGEGYLLNHRRLITLFHEFGHALHDLLARTKYARFHGYEAVQEFVEGIGTVLENWCWFRDQLKAMSRHYTRVDPAYEAAWLQRNPGCDLPPEKIPDDLLDKLLQSRARGKLIHLLNNVLSSMHESLFDMRVHNNPTREALLEMDEAEVYNTLHEKFNFDRLPTPNYSWVQYGYLVAGFDAGYYSYICAQVFAADIFQTTFAANPKSPEAWDKFRREVLEYGGSRDELKILRAHLGGRDPSVEPLLDIVREYKVGDNS